VQVNGGSAHPIFGHLKQLAKQDSIPWNFDKFLISSDGKLVKYATAK
jgi:glutathione peroxidase-family protein